MRHTLALLWQAYSLELRRTFAYRFEFWFRFFGVMFATLGIAYFLWKAVYAATGKDQIEGYSFGAMMLYYLLEPLLNNIVRAKEGGFLSWEIYGGTLTRYLVYPMPFFPYEFVIGLGSATIAVAQTLAAVGIVALFMDFPADVALTPATLALGIVTALIASLLSFALQCLAEMVAFWADNVWSLNVMLMFCIRLLGGAMLPLALFPDWLQKALAYTPFPYLVSFPIQTALGRLDAATWAHHLVMTLLWTAALGLVGALMWKRGNLRYTGVGI